MNGSGGISPRQRVFIGLSDIAGYATGLAAGLRECGHMATVVEVYPSSYGYTRQRHFFTRIFALLSRAKGFWNCAPWRWALEAVIRVVLLVCFLWALVTHDVFVMSYRATFCTVLSFRDWAVLRFFGKRVVAMCHGSDVRPPLFCGYAAPDDPKRIARETRRTMRICRAMERYADAVICNPAFAHHFTRPLVNIFHVGIPADRGGQEQREEEERPVILHCPSAPKGKGTFQIRRMIQELQEEGLDFEYDERIGVQNDEVLSALRRADIVLDQLWCDTPMPGFATEAARAGVPCVVGGEFAEYASRWIPDALMPPTVFVRPEAVQNALRELLLSKEKRRQVGAAARQYAESFRAPKAVARRVLMIAQGEAPPEWLFFPGAAGVMCGTGLPREARQRRAAHMLETYGLHGTGFTGAHLAYVLKIAAGEA